MEEKDIDIVEKNDQKEQKEEFHIEKYNFKSWIKSFIVGIGIGLGIILPGVSGSAFAIIFKVYDKLLYAVSNLLKHFIKCFIYIFPMFIGAVFGFIVGFFTIQNFIDSYMFIICASFGGLMLGATPSIFEEIKGEKITIKRVVFSIIGFIFPLLISLVFANVGGLDTTNLFDTFPFYIHIFAFLTGILLAATQIIPGLSATVLLMSIGFFKPMMNAVHFSTLSEKPIWILFFVIFVIGFIVGFISLSKSISYLLENKKVPMYFLISGLTVGCAVTVFYNTDIKAVYDLWMIGEGNITRDLSIGIPLFFVLMIVAYLLYRVTKKHNANHN